MATVPDGSFHLIWIDNIPLANADYPTVPGNRMALREVTSTGNYLNLPLTT
jgi:hypothetical protein